MRQENYQVLDSRLGELPRSEERKIRKLKKEFPTLDIVVSSLPESAWREKGLNGSSIVYRANKDEDALQEIYFRNPEKNLSLRIQLIGDAEAQKRAYSLMAPSNARSINGRYLVENGSKKNGHSRYNGRYKHR